MALFPNVESDYTFGGKTHTNLVVSEGVAPSEKWVVSKDNAAEPFIYEFGPEGNQTVVLAKGKVVELGAPEYDAVSGRQVSSIKQAVENSKRAVGVLHHSVYEQRRDRFSGNNQPNPTVITRSYIELPLFEHEVKDTAAGFAKAMKFGAAYGTKADPIQPGDFVKVGKDGNLVKLQTEEVSDGTNTTPADSPFEIVGQVLAAERELPPAGFLQYYMEMDVPELEAFLKAQGYAPSPGKNPDGSAGAYPYGYPYTTRGWQSDFEKLLNPTINKGIPFLTDGYFRAKQTVNGISLDDIYDATTNNDGHIEAIRIAGQVTVTGNDVTVAADSRNNALFIKLRHPIDKGEASPITVKHAGGTIASKDVHVDLYQNTVVVYLEAGATLTDVAIDAKLVVDPVAGIPTEWDYAGSVGAIRVLLQR
ncbi:hypothetical protein QO179_24805 [Bacillus stercoris]|nr:hypothetical protein [Bacillus stercoris]